MVSTAATATAPTSATGDPSHAVDRTGSAHPPIAAFTLVELLVVLTLIAIFSALIIPEMKGTLEDALLRSTARKISAAFQIAASQAVHLHQPHRVRIESARGRVTVERRSRRNQGEPGSFAPVRGVPGADAPLDPRIHIAFLQPASDSPPHAPDAPPTPPSTDTPHADLANPHSDSPPADPSTPASNLITFHPDGTADGPDILLKDRHGFELVLTLNPATARVRILRRRQGPEP